MPDVLMPVQKPALVMTKRADPTFTQKIPIPYRQLGLAETRFALRTAHASNGTKPAALRKSHLRMRFARVSSEKLTLLALARTDGVGLQGDERSQNNLILVAKSNQNMLEFCGTTFVIALQVFDSLTVTNLGAGREQVAHVAHL